jgi:hypothetical protein
MKDVGIGEAAGFCVWRGEKSNGAWEDRWRLQGSRGVRMEGRAEERK